jgi:hypothetical protein
MTPNKTRNLIINLIAPLAIALAFTACGKAEKTAPAAATPAALTAAAEKAEPASTPGELPPLAPEAVAIITSNKTEVVYNQVFWITNSAIPSVQKALALMEIMPNFDTDGQRAVAHAAVKYIADSNHTLVSKPLLDGKIDPQLLSIFMTDTLKRPDAIRLPILKALAEKDEHRMKAEATDLLAALTNHPNESAQKQVAN